MVRSIVAALFLVIFAVSCGTTMTCKNMFGEVVECPSTVDRIDRTVK